VAKEPVALQVKLGFFESSRLNGRARLSSQSAAVRDSSLLFGLVSIFPSLIPS
jgi:hypothetical protein